MFTTLFNAFVLYVAVFMAVNISLLFPNVNDETQYMAIRNMFIFAAWALTMRYLVNPQRVPWIIILYSLCILIILMYHTLLNWASFRSLIPDDGFPIMGMSMSMSIQQVSHLKLFMNEPPSVVQEFLNKGEYPRLFMVWFDTLAFFFVVHFLEHRQEYAV